MDPRLVAVFGSTNRVRVLAALAGSLVPKTAYAIAKMVGILPPKAYEGLKDLEGAGIVSSIRSARGARLYRLDDRELARYLRIRAPIMSDDDLRRIAEAGESIGNTTSVLDLRKYRPNPMAVPFRHELQRPASKDRELVRAGLWPSRGWRKKGRWNPKR